MTPQPTSKTPRTDAAEFKCVVLGASNTGSRAMHVSSHFARTLETELEQARQRVDFLSGFEGDMAAIVQTMNRHNYPHHPEYPDDSEIIRRLGEMAAQRDDALEKLSNYSDAYAMLENKIVGLEQERETQEAAIQRHRERMEAVNPGHDFGSFGDSISFLCDAHEELKKERTSLQKQNEKLREAAITVRESIRQLAELANINTETRNMLKHCGNTLNEAINQPT